MDYFLRRTTLDPQLVASTWRELFGPTTSKDGKVVKQPETTGDTCRAQYQHIYRDFNLRSLREEIEVTLMYPLQNDLIPKELYRRFQQKLDSFEDLKQLKDFVERWKDHLSMSIVKISVEDYRSQSNRVKDLNELVENLKNSVEDQIKNFSKQELEKIKAGDYGLCISTDILKLAVTTVLALSLAAGPGAPLLVATLLPALSGMSLDVYYIAVRYQDQLIGERELGMELMNAVIDSAIATIVGLYLISPLVTQGISHISDLLGISLKSDPDLVVNQVVSDYINNLTCRQAEVLRLIRKIGTTKFKKILQAKSPLIRNKKYEEILEDCKKYMSKELKDLWYHEYLEPSSPTGKMKICGDILFSALLSKTGNWFQKDRKLREAHLIQIKTEELERLVQRVAKNRKIELEDMKKKLTVDYSEMLKQFLEKEEKVGPGMEPPPVIKGTTRISLRRRIGGET